MLERKPEPIAWTAALLLAFNALSGLLLLSATLTFGGVAILEWVEHQPDYVSAAMLAAGAFTATLLLIPGALYAFRRLIGLADPDPVTGRLSPLLATGALLLWLAVLFAGRFVLENPLDQAGLWGLMPLLGVLGVILPVWFMTHLALNGLRLGSRMRVWGVFSLGLAAGPLLISLLETIALILFLLVVAIFIAANAGLLRQMQVLVERFGSVTDRAEVLQLIQPYLFKPATIFLTLVVVSVIIPLIEESLKTVGVWIVGRRLTRPIDGFTAGILCGAGYAIFESMGIGANSSSDWVWVTLARFGTDLVHVLNGGLLGWALVSSWREARYGRLGVMFALVVFIHGLWNALSILFGFAHATRGDLAQASWIGRIAPASGPSLVALSLVLIAIIVIFNRRLRAEASEKQV